MAILKKLNQQTAGRLLLESDDSVELPAAKVEEAAAIAQFDEHKRFVPELLETLRAGTLAEPVPMMPDGSTFAVHTPTRTFWIKLWHALPEMTEINRVQVISCLPLMRGKEVVVGDDDDDDFEDDDDDDDEFDDDEPGAPSEVERS